MLTVTLNTRANAAWSRTFLLKKADNTPQDLTGTTMLMQVREAEGEVHAFMTLSNALGGITYASPHSAGSFTITLPQDKLDAMEAGTYVHDLVWVREGGRRQLLWEGTIIHKRGVSR